MRKKYMNPYLAGVLLGLVLLSAMFFSGRGLGASGGLKYAVVAAVETVDHQHAMESSYYSKYFEDGKNPLKIKIEKSPKISNGKRLLFAFLGGVFFVYGAQLARGCTSGAALSGMAVLSVAGFMTMLGIFGSAFLFAWFFRKLWI
jgi:hypothetical protein